MTPQQIRTVSAMRRMAANGEARQRREDLRLSLREMASLLDVPPSTLSRWETGQVWPRAERALRWHKELTRTEGTR